MSMPLVEGLLKYNKEIQARFHMPGHKGKNIGINWDKILPYIDVTEVEGTDNLHNPKDIIKDAQAMAAKAFGAKETFFSVNGTTGGIYGAITSVTNSGDKILVQRDCHRSVYNAAILGRLNLEYIFPKYDNNKHMVMGIDPEDIDKILNKDKEIKAVVITYPSYYGICIDIKKIVDIVHRHNRIIIVDEAHGSHLTFSRKLPMSSLSAGADIVIQSTHKTLPAFTQSSMVHLGTDNIDRWNLKTKMDLFQTTSPSYMLMASLDFARSYMEDEGYKRLDKIIDNIYVMKSKLKFIEGIKLFDTEDIDKRYAVDFDITKLLVSGIDKGLQGRELERILRENYNIQIEMADKYYILSILSVMDDVLDLDILKNALKDIFQSRDKDSKKTDNLKVNIFNRNISDMSIYEAVEKQKKFTVLNQSIGCISGDYIIPYPPGVPILLPGERITYEIVEYITELIHAGIEIMGLEDKNEIAIII
ncbi:aminotransferase class I/II-fold pyridoxal phosphate-dependent enzyme [Clostridiisalibacter paucivorans]|uniref:aminotransferase class I/II-fold pyridoxal phosphate-dependent enzyme n=1 Tax=Clostridiisalibacter paucivorans TaxID=408753 RepID=UPI00047E7186|nr:aminotransferase class I/II-fold pyridoxal phosphate-dependent enzyme [Clostridiisalibacter paucivorans]